jgi:hypothetical protein
MNQHVGSFEIAVDDAKLIEFLEALGDLANDKES